MRAPSDPSDRARRHITSIVCSIPARVTRGASGVGSAR
jgi:hypothetical protein